MACTLVLPCAEKTENIIIIARACQQEGMLFIHVVMADFKTLADVLVQEVIKHDIGKQVIRGKSVEVYFTSEHGLELGT
uniref:Uncharacterized protein n=1 Tax=Sinocyclocheilus rhinocerous TaxID=307959 RepID=A0A673L8K2_9TELE